MLNERQDYFGQTVNIASRVQGLATDASIFATGQVVSHNNSVGCSKTPGITPARKEHVLRGIS